MTDKIKKMKQELKDLAHQIKTNKPIYRQTQSSYDKSNRSYTDRRGNPYTAKDHELGEKAYKLKLTVTEAKYEFRHRHIAYCLLRGRTIEQIENQGQRCKDKHAWGCNCPNMTYVEQLMKEEDRKRDEVIHSGEIGHIEVTASSAGGTCPSGVDALQQGSPVAESNAGVSSGAKRSLLGIIKSYFR